MMGLRTMTVAATEAGGALRRIILLATEAALMAVMSVMMSAAPAAFAHNLYCTGNGTPYGVSGHPADKDGDGVYCGYTRKSGEIVYKDDHGYGGH